MICSSSMRRISRGTPGVNMKRARPMVTAKPHAGCKKFLARFGPDALAFVNSEVGSRMRLRGLNARVDMGGAPNTLEAMRTAKYQSYHTTTPNGFDLQISNVISK